MSILRDALAEYVAIRRGLGTQLRLPAAALQRFVGFLEREGAEFVTTELAVRWAQEPSGAQPSTWAARLGVVAAVALPPLQSADQSARPAEPPRQRAGLPPPRAGVAATDWTQGVYPLHPRARASLAGRRTREKRCPPRHPPAAACPAVTMRARSKTGALHGAAARGRVRW